MSPERPRAVRNHFDALRAAARCHVVWPLVAALALLAPRQGNCAELTISGDYILAFVRYVNWPNEQAIEAWHICMAEGVSSEQDSLYANERINGRRFVVRHVAQTDVLTGCHVIDLTGLDATRSAEIIRRVHELPILTVGSGVDFCSAGGLICLQLRDHEQKFEVNLSAVRASGLNISAKLLRLGSSSSPGWKDQP